MDHRTVVSFAILTPRTIKGLAAPSTDGVVTPLLIVGPAAKADVMAQPAVVGATPERPLQLRRHLELKSLCWVRLRVRLRMALTLLTVRCVLPQPIIPLFKPIESPETLSGDTRAPLTSIVLTWRNTTVWRGEWEHCLWKLAKWCLLFSLRGDYSLEPFVLVPPLTLF